MATPQTTLNGAINASITAVTVRDALGFASTSDTSDLVLCGTEYMLVTAGMGTTSWTVTRGYASSTAASHSDGATVTRIQRQYTDLTKVKTQAKIPTSSTADDAFLLDQIEAANAWMRGEMLGIFLGPSTDASRSYDIPKSTRTLFIPGGVRSVTSLQIREVAGGTLNTVTSTDYVLRPQEWERLPGLASDRIEFIDSAGITGSYTHFYPGAATVVPTGSFGPAEVPADLSRIATTVVVWLYQSRQTGSTGIIGSFETGELIVNRVLSPMDGYTLQRYRHSLDSYSWVG